MRFLTLPFGDSASLETGRFLRAWLPVAVLIGLAAGLGAVAFTLAIEALTELLLVRLLGYDPLVPSVAGAPWEATLERPWLLPLLVAVGGLLSGLLVFLFAPETAGHGTDASVFAFHHRAGRVRWRVPPIKLLASAVLIGSGGSAGRGGPDAQISAGLASLIAQALRLRRRERRIALATGIGAGIGTIFRAPLGGALMAAEVLYVHDLEVEVLLTALVAASVGYAVYGLWFGWEPLFGWHPELSFGEPLQLVYYALIGLVSGLLGMLYAAVFLGTEERFRRLKLPLWAKPALGGLLVGLLGLMVPQVLHLGFVWIEVAMLPMPASVPLWWLAVIPLAKIVATALSVGSGGSGGIFGPSLVVGGVAGAALWHLASALGLPFLPDSPAPFVVVGMMALFGSIAHAPLAMLLMGAELTGSIALLPSGVLAVMVATLVVGNRTIYRSQLPTRADSPAHRQRWSFPLLHALRVEEAMERPARLTPDMNLARAAECLSEDERGGLPVVGPSGELRGIVTLSQLAAVPAEERPARRVHEIMAPVELTLSPGEALDEALEALAESNLSWAPVVSSQPVTRLMGVIGARDIVRTYRASIGSARRTFSSLGSTDLVEVEIERDWGAAGRPLRALKLPGRSLVVSLRREGELLVPRGDTVLRPGDVAVIIASAAGPDEIRAYLREFQATSD